MKFGVYLESIRQDVDASLKSKFGDTVKVVMDNIALLEELSSEGVKNGTTVVMSVVKIEEEKTLKNAHSMTSLIQPNGNSKVFKHNPIVYLNLYILFSIPATKIYKDALNLLGIVIEYFQHKNIKIFNNLNPVEGELVVEKFIFELQSLTFEQINHMWGVLGGKYMPSVLYKVRLIPVRGPLPEEDQPLIKEEGLKSTNK